VISSEIVHCLNALGSVKKEQRQDPWGDFCVTHCDTIETSVSIPHLLFFLYEPLCMSLHPARAGLITHAAAQLALIPDPLYIWDLNNRALLQPKTSKASLCALQKKDR
jgi:hypothetical protein